MLKKLFDDKIKVGELYTRLAIKGKEMDGPIEAAKKLLQFLTKEI